MRKIVLLLVWGLLLGLVSCAKKDDGLKVIPKDAIAVVSFNLPSLSEKSDVDELVQLPTMQQFREKLHSKNQTLGQLYDQLLNNSEISGINLKKDAYLFVCNGEAEGDSYYTALTFPLTDEATFAKFVTQISEAVDYPLDIITEGKQKILEISGDYLSWDNHQVLVLFTSQVVHPDAMIRKLFRLKKEEQLSSVEGFSEFLSGQKDVNVWLNFEALAQKNELIVSSFYGSLFNHQKDSYFCGFLDFGKSDIKFTTYTLYNNDTKALLKKYNLHDVVFNKELLKYFGAKMPIAVGGAVNVKNYLEFLESQMGETTSEVAQLQLLLGMQGISKNDLLNFFGGSFVAGVQGFEKQQYTYYDYMVMNSDYISVPTGDDINSEKYRAIEKELMVPVLGFALDVKNKALLDKMMDIAGLVTEEGGYYKQPIDDEFTFYFTYTDKVFYGSNSENSVKDFLAGNYPADNAVNTNFGKQLSKDFFYFDMSLIPSDYPSEYIAMFRDTNKDENVYYFDLFTRYSKRIEMKRVDDITTEMIYHLNGIEKNSLNTLLKVIDEIITNEN